MKNFILIILFSFVAFNLKAQDPNWSLDSSNYQFNMTLTTFLNINGTTLSSAEDKVGAFVNGELRGTANVTYVASANKYVAYLSVFANTDGELVNFKVYKRADNNVYDIPENLIFKIDGNVGGIFQSFSIANPTLNNQAVLNSFSFFGITSVSETINNTNVTIVVPFGTDVSNLIPKFSISNGATFFVNKEKQVSETTQQDFTNAINYTLVSENEATLLNFTIQVIVDNQNIAIPELVLSSNNSSFVNKAPVLINLQTNVPLSGLNVKDISLENAIISSIQKESELNYVLQVVPIQQGSFSLEILVNRVFNSQNNGNLASNKLIFTYDLIQPYLISIKRKNAQNEFTTSKNLEFIVVFNEAVKNVLATDFTSSLAATISLVSESESRYTLKLSNISSFGAVFINIKPTNNIQDKAGNVLLNSQVNRFQN